MQRGLTYVSGEGRYRVQVVAQVTDDGISATITGGEKPHVGGVALSVPRISLNGDAGSCDTWLTPVPGHKDVLVAAPAAERLCKAFGCSVAVTAGIHIDDAEKWEIDKLIEHSETVVKHLCDELKK